jgi:glycosyltransferase involved in cell wall biosynthesis
MIDSRMEAPFQVLVVIKGLGLGGAERLVVDSLPYLDRTRFAYEFAYLLPWKDHLVSQIEAAGFPVYCLGTGAIDGGRPAKRADKEPAAGRWREAGILAGGLRRLWRLQQRRGYDLIQADLAVAGVLARMVGRWHGARVVYTEHNLQARFHPLTRRINGLTYGWNDCVVAVSEEVAASIERSGLHRKTRVVTVRNGIPVEQIRAEATSLDSLRAELGIPERSLVVGTVAVFRQQKRLEDWLEVAARIAGERENVTFLLVGHGPEDAVLKARVEELGLEDRVFMPGFRADGRRVLGLMDVYLMTSIHEGLPIALLEAMALAKPVVSTAVGGIPEVVEEGKEGFLTEVGEIRGLATAVLRLLDSAALRREVGQRGAQKVERQYHIRHRVGFIEDIYRELLLGPRDGRGVKGGS